MLEHSQRQIFAFKYHAKAEYGLETGGMPNMEPLTFFLSSMIALSVAVERVVEIIKGLSPKLREDPDPRVDPQGKGAARRRLVLQGIAAVVGAIAALTIGPHNFLNAIPDGGYQTPVRWIASLFLGLIASGGSAFWNHALDIVGAIKSVKEQVANLQQAPATPRPKAPVGP